MTLDRLDPSIALAELGRINLAEHDLHGVLAQVAQLTRRTFPGADEVSVTLVRGGAAETAAHTGPLALVLDEWQYYQASGPCLEAATKHGTVLAASLPEERRWPGWSEHAVAAGARSSLSIGLPIEDQLDAALNLYSRREHAFNDEAVTLAETFAGYAAIALANATLYGVTAKLARQLETAMASRAVIEQAKGIIMGRRRCTAEEAFAILTKTSQDSNRKLRDVAAALVAKAQHGDER